MSMQINVAFIWLESDLLTCKLGSDVDIAMDPDKAKLTGIWNCKNVTKMFHTKFKTQ